MKTKRTKAIEESTGRLWYLEVSDAIEPGGLAATADRFTTAKNAR